MMTISEISSPYSLAPRLSTRTISPCLIPASCGAAGESVLRILDASISHDCPHDLLLRDFLCGELADEAAFVHDIDAVAHAKKLRHFRRNHDDALARFNRLIDDAVDFVFRAHINTARGLVQDEDFGSGKQ